MKTQRVCSLRGEFHKRKWIVTLKKQQGSEKGGLYQDGVGDVGGVGGVKFPQTPKFPQTRWGDKISLRRPLLVFIKSLPGAVVPFSTVISLYFPENPIQNSPYDHRQLTQETSIFNWHLLRDIKKVYIFTFSLHSICQIVHVSSTHAVFSYVYISVQPLFTTFARSVFIAVAFCL